MWLKDEVRKDASGLSSLLLYACRPDDNVLLLYDGAFQATWQYEGRDLGTISRADALAKSTQTARALNFGSNWMVETDACRRAVFEYPATQPNAHPVIRLIDEERRLDAQAVNAQLRSTYYLTLTYLPPNQLEQRTFSWLSGDRREKRSDAEQRRLQEKSLRFFEDKCDLFESSLRADYHMTRLGVQGEHDEQLRFLRDCVLGDDHPFAAPDIPFYLNMLFASELHTHHPTRIGGRFCRAIAAEVYPSVSAPRLFWAFETLPFPCRWHTRHIQFDSETSRKIHEKNRRHWESQQHGLGKSFGIASKPDKDATDMVLEADDAEAEAKRGQFIWGDYQNKILLWGDSLDEIGERTKIIQQLFQTAGFGPRTEETNSMDSIRASWPGHGYSDVRQVPVHTRNVADLMPSSTPFTGRRYNPSQHMPPNTPCLSKLSTDGNTPFDLHLHHGDVPHSLVIGPTRAGKSFFLATMASQWLARYEHAQVIAFDKKASLLTLCHAVGGEFFDFRPSTRTLCPLADLSTPDTQAWARSYVELLFRLTNCHLTATQGEQLSTAIVSLAAKRAERRSLTDLSSTLGVQELSKALSYFTLGSVSGGAMLDGTRDGLHLKQSSPMVVFDMDHLFSIKDRRLLQAVLPYLFEVIRRRLDGRPTLILFDESWMGLEDPVFESVLKSWIKELAKLNAALMLATQNISDYSQSHLRHVVMDQCQTRIILPTASARSASRDLFRTEFGFTDEQLEIIAAGTTQRDYFISQGDTFRRVQLYAQGVQKAFLGANDLSEQRQFQELMKQDPLFGAADWLRARRLDRWATKLEDDLREYQFTAEDEYACA